MFEALFRGSLGQKKAFSACRIQELAVLSSHVFLYLRFSASHGANWEIHMRGRFGSVQLRELALTAGPVVLVILAAFWMAAQFIAPGPPKTIVIATATKGSPYYEAALRYRSVFAENGVTLELLETKGSLENLSLLKDPRSPVAAAFLQGGLATSVDVPDVRSIGRLFHEPVWIFTQGAVKPERLTQFVGKRVLIGPAGSATAALAERLLTVSGINRDTASLINMELPD
jgi:uncharacterized protein